jgi:hypothetical protein
MGIIMHRYARIPLCIGFAVTISQVWAAEKPSDSEIRRELVGSWIVPLDSSDRTLDTDRMLEIFRPDGTYTLFYFQNSDCRTIARQTEVKWMVRDGVLITVLPTGSALRDEVISIGNGKMMLHSLDDGTTYARTKADTCTKAGA